MERYVIMGDDGGVMVVLMTLVDAKVQAESLHVSKRVPQRIVEQGGKVVYLSEGRRG